MLHNVAALIPDRADEEGGPEHAAILAVVTNFQVSVGVAVELGFDLRHHLRIGAARHQEIEALAQHLAPVVSGERERKLSLAKMIGLSGPFVAVNTIAIRVV